MARAVDQTVMHLGRVVMILVDVTGIALLGLCTLPLGGFLEHEVAARLALPETDLVLYLGVCGRPM